MNYKMTLFLGFVLIFLLCGPQAVAQDLTPDEQLEVLQLLKDAYNQTISDIGSCTGTAVIHDRTRRGSGLPGVTEVSQYPVDQVTVSTAQFWAEPDKNRYRWSIETSQQSFQSVVTGTDLKVEMPLYKETAYLKNDAYVSRRERPNPERLAGSEVPQSHARIPAVEMRSRAKGQEMKGAMAFDPIAWLSGFGDYQETNERFDAFLTISKSNPEIIGEFYRIDEVRDSDGILVAYDLIVLTTTPSGRTFEDRCRFDISANLMMTLQEIRIDKNVQRRWQAHYEGGAAIVPASVTVEINDGATGDFRHSRVVEFVDVGTQQTIAPALYTFGGLAPGTESIRVRDRMIDYEYLHDAN